MQRKTTANAAEAAPGPAPDIGAVFRAASEQFTRIVGSVHDTTWERPTVSRVSVRELVEHVLAGNEFAVRLLGGASADEARAGIDQIHLGSNPTTQVATSCTAQTDAFARADRTRSLHHPSGDIDYETFVRFRLGELVIHAWDVAHGGGLNTNLDPDIVRDLWARVEPHLDQMREMGAYGRGASGQLPPDAPLQTRLLDAFGRHPQ